MVQAARGPRIVVGRKQVTVSVFLRGNKIPGHSVAQQSDVVFHGLFGAYFKKNKGVGPQQKRRKGGVAGEKFEQALPGPQPGLKRIELQDGQAGIGGEKTGSDRLDSLLYGFVTPVQVKQLFPQAVGLRRNGGLARFIQLLAEGGQLVVQPFFFPGQGIRHGSPAAAFVFLHLNVLQKSFSRFRKFERPAQPDWIGGGIRELGVNGDGAVEFLQIFAVYGHFAPVVVKTADEGGHDGMGFGQQFAGFEQGRRIFFLLKLAGHSPGFRQHCLPVI